MKHWLYTTVAATAVAVTLAGAPAIAQDAESGKVLMMAWMNRESLQLTVDEAKDAPVPGKPYTFGILRRAQAQGDLQALREHGRRVMRIHLGDDAVEGLKAVQRILGRAIAG